MQRKKNIFTIGVNVLLRIELKNWVHTLSYCPYEIICYKLPGVFFLGI